MDSYYLTFDFLCNLFFFSFTSSIYLLSQFIFSVFFFRNSCHDIYILFFQAFNTCFTSSFLFWNNKAVLDFFFYLFFFFFFFMSSYHINHITSLHTSLFSVIRREGRDNEEESGCFFHKTFPSLSLSLLKKERFFKSFLKLILIIKR